MLHIPAGLDGRKVMAALASNESSTGANCGPRHEPAYDKGGSLATGAQQAAALAAYGSDAACSYGPWQMMFVNFPRGTTPDELTSEIDVCAQGFVQFFNAYVMGARKAETLKDIGQIWNFGHKTDTPPVGVVRYCNDLQAAYDKA